MVEKKRYVPNPRVLLIAFDVSKFVWDTPPHTHTDTLWMLWLFLDAFGENDKWFSKYKQQEIHMCLLAHISAHLPDKIGDLAGRINHEFSYQFNGYSLTFKVDPLTFFVPLESLQSIHLTGSHLNTEKIISNLMSCSKFVYLASHQLTDWILRKKWLLNIKYQIQFILSRNFVQKKWIKRNCMQIKTLTG